MERRDAGVRGTARRSHRPVARRLGAVVAGLLVVAGTTTVFDASSTVLGSAPPSETLSCNDNWVGGGTSGDWDSAANWSTGVPTGTDVECLHHRQRERDAHRRVVLHRRAHGVGRQQPHHRRRHQYGDTESEHLVRPAERRVPDCWRRRDVGHPGLSLNGPITNSGTLTVDGTVGLVRRGRRQRHRGAATTAPSASHPGAWSTETERTTITNDPTGSWPSASTGRPAHPTAYGRITGSTLALGGTADPVDEDGFTPPAGAEYFVG